MRWWVLALLAVAIAGNYYAYDSIAPIAGLLRSARGLGQSQIGMLNAVFSLPNIALALVGGILIDRFGPSRVALWTAATCFAGALLTAVGSPYGVMVCGRLLFGIGEETLLIALLAGLAQWFAGGGMALAMALFFSLARVGSYAADISPRWAHSLYERGWQAPLWLAAAITGASLVAAIAYAFIDRGTKVDARSRGRAPNGSAGRISAASTTRFGTSSRSTCCSRRCSFPSAAPSRSSISRTRKASRSARRGSSTAGSSSPRSSRRRCSATSRTASAAAPSS